MKKSICFLSFLTALMLTIQAQIQYPVNGGFENWTTSSIGGMTYDSLVKWHTPQRNLTALGVSDELTKRTSIANSGLSASLLMTKEVDIAGLYTYVLPGLISTGTFNFNVLTQEWFILGGTSIDCKPTFLSGFYRYAPAGTDKANIAVYLTSASGDTVAQSFLEIPSATTGGYQLFNIPLIYTGVDDPVQVQILITSGELEGSAMMVDDVVLRGGDCFTSPVACSPSAAPTGQSHTPLFDRVRLKWNPNPGAVGCFVQGQRLPSGPAPTTNVLTAPYNTTNVPFSVAGAGTTWTWRVRCACSLTPLDLTPYTAYGDTFSIPVARELQNLSNTAQSGALSLYPNPATNQITVEGDMGVSHLEIVDAVGRLSQVVPIQEASSGQQTIQLNNVEPGFYMLVGRYSSFGTEHTETLPFTVQ